MDNPSGLLALSRPGHYLLFGLFLAGLFVTTFRVTQAMVDPEPAEDPIEPLELTLPDLPLAAAKPKPLPDLVFAEMIARECVSTDPGRPGGLLTLTVRNDGKGTARGFALFATLDVENLESGASQRVEVDHWVQRLPPGDEVTLELAYGFPVRESPLMGPVVLAQPVPGSYRLEVTLDRPSFLPTLGEVGVLEEGDESNNTDEMKTSGAASGLC